MSDDNLNDNPKDKADYAAYKREKTIKKLGERTHLSLGKIVKLVAHEEYGALVGEITLQDLIDLQLKAQVEKAIAKLNKGQGNVQATTEAPKRRGRPPKAKAEGEAPKRRGRPPKAKAEGEAPKRRGRPPKAKAEGEAPKRRGRPPKAKAEGEAPKKAKKEKAPKKAKKAKKAKKEKAPKKAKKEKAPKGANGHKADFGKKKPRLQRDQGYKEVLAAIKAAEGPCGRGVLEEATGYTGVQVRTFCKELAEQGKLKVLGSGGRSTKYAIA